MSIKYAISQKLMVLMIMIISFIILLLLSNKIAFTDTGSIPIGFYSITHHKINVLTIKNKYVLFCLPSILAHIGMKAGYIVTNQKSICAEHSEALGKRVIAIPGDEIMISNKGIKVNHIFYAAPLKTKDANGHLIKRFIHNGVHKATGIWLYGDGDIINSWDSRYWGSIPIQNLISIIKPIFTSQ